MPIETKIGDFLVVVDGYPKPSKYDAELTKDAGFMAWISALEDAWRADGWQPFGLPLAQSTGLVCWHSDYKEGRMPADIVEAYKSVTT